MNSPSSRHLSQDYEAYKGLSLRELFWIAMATTPTVSVVCALLGLLLGYPLAVGCVGFILGFIISITLCPKRAARIKAGKPQGYLMKKSLLFLAKLGLKQSPYLHYRGPWQKSKLGSRTDV